MSLEQEALDMQWMKKCRPSTWDEFASWVDEYMRLKEGWVAFEARSIHKTTLVRTNLIQSLFDVLGGHKPRMRKTVELGPKYAIIKVMDRYGKPIVHTSFEYDALAVFDGAKVVEIGKKTATSYGYGIGGALTIN